MQNFAEKRILNIRHKKRDISGFSHTQFPGERIWLIRSPLDHTHDFFPRRALHIGLVVQHSGHG